jgi:hypothetical protein
MFAPKVEDEQPPVNAPMALGSFMGMFSKLTESFWFYKGEVELRFDKEEHIYFKVEELGNLTPVDGVTTVVKVIDRSPALIPWAAKEVANKMLRIVPTVMHGINGTGVLMVKPMTFEEFSALVMEAKKAPREEFEEAGDIGHMAHECLEHSIRYVLDHTEDHIVRVLRNLPENTLALNAANAAKAWMDAHNVRWLHTERKVYSRKHNYAGTMDGKALVDSCSDRTCCAKPFKNHLSLIDWKSSNHLHVSYLYQTASYEAAEEEEAGDDIVDRWVLRLGKNEEEAGKFEPWYMRPEDFQEDLDGFLACLALRRLLQRTEERVKYYRAGIRTAKKEAKAEAKILAKAQAKVAKAAAKAERRIAREAEKKRIQAEAEAARKAEVEHIKAEARVARDKLKEQDHANGGTGQHPEQARTVERAWQVCISGQAYLVTTSLTVVLVKA